MRNHLITALIIGLAGICAQGQTLPAPGSGPQGPGGYERPIAPSPEIVALRQELRELHATLEASRREAITNLGEDPTLEAKTQALADWSAENAELIIQVDTIAQELRTLMQDYRPGFPTPRPVPDEIIALRDELRALREELAQSRAAVIDALGPEATREEIAEALKQWRLDNAEEIEQSRELAMVISTWFRENRPQRPDRPGPAAEVQQRREEFKEKAQNLAAERRALREELRGATPEEREAKLRAFQEQQTELMQERRELKRAERLGGRQGGDSRRGG